MNNRQWGELLFRFWEQRANQRIDRFTEPSTEPPSVEHTDEGPKGWVVAVAVLTTLIIVALGLAALIWWKWRGVTPASWLGYKRQQDFTTEE